MCQINGEVAKVRTVSRDKSVTAFKVVRVDWEARAFRPLFARSHNDAWESRYTVYKSHAIPNKRPYSRTGFHAFMTVAGAIKEAAGNDVIIPVKLWVG